MSLLLFLLQSTVILFGSVESKQFQHLEFIDVEFSRGAETNSFSHKDPIVSILSDSTFMAEFYDPGFYGFQVRAPYHESIYESFYFDTPDTIRINIKMEASLVDKGEFFHDPEYLKWFHAEGNFNDWDDENGIPFAYDSTDGSIYSIIETDLDTVWYNISGIGPKVLPGAVAYDFISGRNQRRTIAAALIPQNGKVELRYRPGEYPLMQKYQKQVLDERRNWSLEKSLDFYFTFEDSLHRSTLLELDRLRQLYSGFFRRTKDKYMVTGKFQSFNHNIDSLFQIALVADRVSIPTIAKIQHFAYIKSVMLRIEAEMSLGIKAHGSPIIERDPQWKLFVQLFNRYSGADPLWYTLWNLSHSFGALWIIEPNTREQISNIAFQTSYKLFSQDLFFDVGRSIAESGQGKEARKWATEMETRFKNVQKTQELKDFISKSER